MTTELKSDTSKSNTIEILHSTSATPAPGFGVGIDNPALLFKADSSTVALRNIGRISFAWENPTDAVRTSIAIIEIVKEGELVVVAKITANGEIVSL